ncbi:hypothetical protein BU24DRAFT_487407 [Aaosphaeria arxii CBS 175.79]|uniref:Zn(2)-C6 fungal-type domain-containing protein n=1 Tax=Aaosphaeria arxii CBS 175.79 TaxID=1450172 RepID=A0A6A5Y5V0_9PLEO|nr:uncharacterized protein BU24DRAFT_487407 [Aaosphaeria arxii CBS 175.79]KAF2020878.1 hypothetical protein BU24DRAFT_487407 [Aaosphaeria arxii CBS 175.79]
MTSGNRDSPVAIRSSAASRRIRKPINCEACRRSKLRCDRRKPCNTCIRRALGDACTYVRVTGEITPQGHNQIRHPDTTQAHPRGTPRTVSSVLLPSPQVVPTTNLDSQREDGQNSRFHWDDVLLRPTNEAIDTITTQPETSFPFPPTTRSPIEGLLSILPSASCCDYLVTRFFTHVSPLFNVVHGPTFQQQYTAFLRSPEQTNLAWLGLLFVVCSLTLLTLDEGDPILHEISRHQQQAASVLDLSNQFRRAATTCLAHDSFLTHHNLNTLEALLLLIYAICHLEGVERGWTLLGIALNIGIALKCHITSPGLGQTERERRHRLWSGILMLHTYQAILYRDIDLSGLLKIPATVPAEIDTGNLTDDASRTTGHGSQMTLMKFKIRLFELSTKVCSHLSGTSLNDEPALNSLDAAIQQEQTDWDSAFLIDGMPSILDTTSYAHWCILQTYAHQLYLLLHKPFHHQRSGTFRTQSRQKCIESSVALLDLYRQFYELPRLKSYRWLLNGMTSFNALQASVALSSCLLGVPTLPEYEDYIKSIDATMDRMKELQVSSPVCVKAYPILRKLHQQLTSEHTMRPEPRGIVDDEFWEWIDGVDWSNFDSIDLGFPNDFPENV